LRESTLSIKRKRQDSPYQILIKETDLDEKEMAIYNYIANNPETTKQNVVDFFKDKPGYSRNPVYDIIERLQGYRLITVKLDKNNSQKHRLSINNESVLVSLSQVLDYFKNNYFSLLEEIKPFISRENNLAHVSPVELVECLIMLYKFTKDRFSDFLLWRGKSCDNDTLHRKFGIIYKSMDEVLIELYQSLVDVNFISYSEEMERFLNYSRSDVLGPENLIFITSTFEKCGLRKYVEPIIDLLWSLFYRRLPLLYLDYEYLSKEGKLKGWRDLVDEKKRNWPTKQKLLFCYPCS
jgi:hypothetical protein